MSSYYPFKPGGIDHKCPSCEAPLRTGGGRVGQDLVARFRIGCLICGFQTGRAFEPEKLHDLHNSAGPEAVEAKIEAEIKKAHEETK
jgi:hypothetical protein